MTIFDEIRQEYEYVAGEKINPRVKDNAQVELRAALVNAMRPYCKDMHVAKMIEKDRSTLVHYAKQHDTYYSSSYQYRAWYIAAEAVVSKKLGEVPREVKRPNARIIASEAELAQIERTIRLLFDVRKKIKDEIRKRKQPDTLLYLR